MKHIAAPKGVFAAALTPIKLDGSIDLDSILPYLTFLASRGCHGALLFGTTGEGPSFSLAERQAVGRKALEIRQDFPEFQLLMGTGTPSITETVEITRMAFDLGFAGVVVLPPYFNRKVSDEGLFAWFSTVIRQGVPTDGQLIGYHIPQMTGVPLSIDLLDRLKSQFPDQFIGIKNSWVEEDFVVSLGSHFGPDLLVMTGFDNYFALSLEKHASGCITASATLISPLLRKLWDAHHQGADTGFYQSEVNRIRAVLDRYPPAPALIKGLLARWHQFPGWAVRPPLVPVVEEILREAEELFSAEYR
jgi:4-hydroxy-tetrahydrodipicolinate synthase